MIKGFVFGKFLPFHLGHQALIESGAGQCDKLTVLVCASTKESISGAVRTKWIAETFKEHPKVKVATFSYDESLLPNTSASSEDVSEIWAREFIKLIPSVHVLFTSEPYGEYVAQFMGIRHVPFDEKRTQFSISGSELRSSLYEHWEYLPKSVKSYFQKKVVILGTESTGKSTLAEHLHQQFRSSVVHEVGRDIIHDSKEFTIDQLEEIAAGHGVLIHKTCQSLAPLIIIDTDIHITQSYAGHTFGDYLELPDSLYDINRADLYLYLNPKVPYFQDGTRLEETERNELDTSHRMTLAHFGVAYKELSGNYDERSQQAVELISDLLNRFD